MEWFTLAALSLVTGSVSGVAFIVCKIIQEEKEKKEKAAFVRAFSERYNKRTGCPSCGCLPCQCGS
jgi:hypothetical protein